MQKTGTKKTGKEKLKISIFKIGKNIGDRKIIPFSIFEQRNIFIEYSSAHFHFFCMVVACNRVEHPKDFIMSKKIIFKGTLEECYLPGKTKLLQLNLQEPKTVEPATVCCFFDYL